MKLFVTTSFKADQAMIKLAEQLACKLDSPYIKRANQSLAVLSKITETDTYLVVGKKRVTLYCQGQQYFFHPSLAKLRIKALQKGEPDQFLSAIGLQPGDSLLDCTLGLAADAIVASFQVGQQGQVIGVESSPLISLLVKLGLQSYHDEDEELNKAMRRITVYNENYEKFLAKQSANSFDYVYFDPMFRQAINKSDAIGAIRPLVNNSPVSILAIKEAERVARKAVIIKERRESPEFARLQCQQIVGGKYSSIAYGIIEVNK